MHIGMGEGGTHCLVDSLTLQDVVASPRALRCASIPRGERQPPMDKAGKRDLLEAIRRR